MAELARVAGVSTATVSRALANKDNVAPETRRRVLDAAARLSYVVSPEASRLRGGATGRVGVLTPELTDWKVVLLLGGFETTLRDSGLELLLYCVGRSRRERFLAELPLRRKVDAVAMLGLDLGEGGAERVREASPVLVAAGALVPGAPSVLVDEHGSGLLALGHLRSLGHRRIGMVHSAQVDLGAAPLPALPGAPDGRSRAYLSALATAGIPLGPRPVLRVPQGAPDGEQLGRWWAAAGRPTAVYAATDRLAIDVLRTFAAIGVDVPGEVSVVGVGGHPLAAVTGLSTVAQPVREQGRLAACALLAALRGEPPTARTVLSGRLAVRGSTAAPREP